MQKHELSGQLVWWAVELSKFDIQYKPRPSIKLQSLSDFVAECTVLDDATVEELTEIFEDELAPFSRPWILHVDGLATSSMSGADIILTNPEQMMFEYTFWFAFSASNNEADYEALITGLTLAKELGAQEFKVFSDSQLVVGQVNGEFEARSPSMIEYLRKVKKIAAQFQTCKVQQIPRSENA